MKMLSGVRQARLEEGEQLRLNRRSDRRAVTSEVAEVLAMLVGPALLLSGTNFFFG